MVLEERLKEMESDYKNINFIKIYEIIGDAFYYGIESCGSNKKLIKSISVQEDSKFNFDKRN